MGLRVNVCLLWVYAAISLLHKTLIPSLCLSLSLLLFVCVPLTVSFPSVSPGLPVCLCFCQPDLCELFVLSNSQALHLFSLSYTFCISVKLLEDCVSDSLSWSLLSWHLEGGTATSSVKTAQPPNPRQESQREHVRKWRKR